MVDNDADTPELAPCLIANVLSNDIDVNPRPGPNCID